MGLIYSLIYRIYEKMKKPTILRIIPKQDLLLIEATHLLKCQALYEDFGSF